MGRFLLGVGCMALLWWGYGAWFGDAESEAAERGATLGASLGAGESDSEVTPARVRSTPEGASDQAGTSSQAGMGGDSQPADFRSLAAAIGPSRDRLAVELMQRVREAGAVDELLEVLGPDNSFLHTETGRQAAELARSRLLGMDPFESAKGLSRLFERCAAGTVEADAAPVRAQINAIRQSLQTAAARSVFDPSRAVGCKEHVVGPGESLVLIAKRYRNDLALNLDHGTLQIINGIADPSRMQVGTRLLIPMQAMRTVVWKRSFLVGVYLGDVLVRTYWCAHGRPGQDTPVTTFEIGKKLDKPNWHPGGRVVPYGHPDNPLGTHFVEFLHPVRSGFGIHGTWEPDSIGHMASAGCIRLSNDDIAEYALLVPTGTTVEIRS